MKFKADFTDHGLRTLEKGEHGLPNPSVAPSYRVVLVSEINCCAGILPTLEKFGKTCQLLLGPEDLHLLQTAVNTDGVHTTARLAHVSNPLPPSCRCSHACIHAAGHAASGQSQDRSSQLRASGHSLHGCTSAVQLH